MKTFRNNANSEIAKTADSLISTQMKAESYLKRLLKENADTKKIMEIVDTISDSQFILGVLVGMSQNGKD